MAYAALDYYALDELFTHEERMVRDTVRELVTTRVMPTIGKHLSAGTFPHELVPVFGEMGLLGPSLTGYGCAGISPTAYGLICQELERGDSGIRSFCSVQGSLVMYPIWAFGSEEQKQKWLPEMAAGRVIGCFGLTEPDFGSNPTGMLTTRDARRRRLPAQRHEALDHERLGRARRARVGQARRQGARLPRPDEDAGLHRA